MTESRLVAVPLPIRSHAVYVPLPTGIRTAWLIRAAGAGKHVLSAMASDVQEILAACQGNGVQFMDGVMFMHSRRFNYMTSCVYSAGIPVVSPG
jgi:predicted dehydrogenase